MKKTLNFAKFTTIAIALGFISPTITTHNDPSTSGISEVSFSIVNTAKARDNGNRNRNRNKNTNKNKNRNTNKNSNRNTNRNSNVNVNRNKNSNTNVNVNRNRNRNTNKNVNVNVNNNRRGPRPLTVLAGMAIGTAVVASAMSPSCTTVIVNGNSYRQCDGTYFQQNGPDYIVVKSPY